MIAAIVSKLVPFLLGGEKHESVWLWNSRLPDHIVIVLPAAPDEDPNVWQVGADVLEGDVIVDDARLTYVGQEALLALDGDGRAAELRCEAGPLLDFHLDIQVAKSADHFTRELRGLIDG